MTYLAFLELFTLFCSSKFTVEMVSLQPEGLNISCSTHLLVTSFLRFCMKRSLFSLNHWRVIFTEYRTLGYLFYFQNFKDVLVVFWLVFSLMRNQWISDLSSLVCTPFLWLFFSLRHWFSAIWLQCMACCGFLCLSYLWFVKLLQSVGLYF